MPFWRFFYPRLQEVFPEQFRGVELDRFYAAINRVQPSLIRIRADEVTYGMHVILRFELEQDIINGRVELRDLPRRWARRCTTTSASRSPTTRTACSRTCTGRRAHRLLLDVPARHRDVRADLGEGADDIGDLEERIERGEFAALREWLGEHVHAHGRKFTPQETLRRATGSTIDAKPYLAYLKRKYGAPVAA